MKLNNQKMKKSSTLPGASANNSWIISNLPTITIRMQQFQPFSKHHSIHLSYHTINI